MHTRNQNPLVEFAVVASAAYVGSSPSILTQIVCHPCSVVRVLVRNPPKDTAMLHKIPLVGGYNDPAVGKEDEAATMLGEQDIAGQVA